MIRRLTVPGLFVQNSMVYADTCCPGSLEFGSMLDRVCLWDQGPQNPMGPGSLMSFSRQEHHTPLLQFVAEAACSV